MRTLQRWASAFKRPRSAIDRCNRRVEIRERSYFASQAMCIFREKSDSIISVKTTYRQFLQFLLVQARRSRRFETHCSLDFEEQHIVVQFGLITNIASHSRPQRMMLGLQVIDLPHSEWFSGELGYESSLHRIWKHCSY